MSLFALTHDDLGNLFDQIPRLATRTGIEDLTGGLTNRNVKVTTPDGVYVARCSDREHNPLGIDRDAEHVNTERAERAGVGAPVLDYRPDLGVLVIGWLEGTTLDNEAFTRPDVVRRAAAAIRMLHEGERFDGDFDMFRLQQGYLATCRDHGHRMPDDYLDHADAFDRIRRALAVNDQGTVPCNNDLLAANFIDDGAKIWLIDYEYAGNNDACFELGNTVQECHLDLDCTEALVAGYFGEVTRARLARVRLQAVVAAVRLDPLGLHPARREPARVRLLGMGDGAVRRRGGRDARARLRGPARRRGRQPVTSAVPDRAQIVVVGGGVIGTSVAYHLTRLGRTDVLLLEQGRLSSGTTWHAAGLVGQLRASESGTRLVQYSTELYARLEEETGLSAGYKRCGGVTVARTPERMTQLRRTAATAAAYDLECELLTPEQALERYPVMAVDDLVGAIWLPGDGKANPTDLTQALAKGARMRGARIVEQVRVTGVRVERGRATGVSARRWAGRGRGGGQLRRTVGAAGRRPRRRHRAAALGRALLRRHRAVRRRPPRPAGAARPGRLHLLQGGGRRPGRRRLRAGGQAVGLAARGAVPVRVPAARGGLGALLGADGQRPAPDPGAARDRDPQVLQRSRELHPRQPVPARRGARGAWLLRRRGLQLGGHRLRRRRGPGARGVDRRG